MWELDYKGNWAPKNWYFWTVVLEKTLESPLDSRQVKPVSPKGNRSWIFIGRTDVEAENPLLWPPDVTNWLIRIDPDPGKDWSQEEKRTTEDEMVGWHHQLDEHEFEQALGVGDGQGSPACCSPWGRKELNTTEWLNSTDLWGNCFSRCGTRSWHHPGISLGFPGGSDDKEFACSVGDLGSVPGLGRSPGGGHGNPLQYSCQENPHGQWSLTGCSPWGHKESGTTEQWSTVYRIEIRLSYLLSMWQISFSLNWMITAFFQRAGCPDGLPQLS